MTTRASRSLRTVTTALSTGAALALPSVLGLASGPAHAGESESEIGRVFALTNAERAEAGCKPLGRDAAAGKAAQRYAQQMARSGTLSHTGSDGSTFVERMRAAGHGDPGAENIARGQDSAREVVAQWMDSPSHRENILDCSLRTLGVGHTDEGDFWVQEFGR